MTPTDQQLPDARGCVPLTSRAVDGAWLAAFRVLFGGAMAVSMARFVAYDWVRRLFVEPEFRFKYWGFHWVHPLPEPGMTLLFVGLGLAALATACGLWFRGAALLLAAGLSYFQLLDVSTYLNHYYLAALLAWLLALSPAGRVHSVDAWRRPAARASGAMIAGRWLLLFRFQVALVYVCAGLAKAQPDWLIHAQPLRMWLGASTELPLIGPLLLLPGAPLVMSWAGFLFDLTIALWLSLRATRAWALGAVVVFHVLTRILFPIGMFPVIMVLSALVFLEPDWPRRAARWMTSRWRLTSRRLLAFGADAPAAAHKAIGLNSAGRVGWAALGVYCALQALMPLRHWAYGENVLWHEQGMRYSWRVMVRAKGGSAIFHVRNPKTGVSWRVDPSQYLTPMQESEMAAQPDLILQFAHHLQSEFERVGSGPVEVRVDAHATLNGRRRVRLINPDTDLTTVQDGLSRAHFVLPAPQMAPPHTRLVP